MTSFRQIEANRRNATRSTGPNTEEGKRRSRGNAVRHGLCAETVIETVEDTEDYCAFEAAIIADYDAQTAVERELVLRLASLLWRLRRATAIETDLLRIQAEILRDRRSKTSSQGHQEQPQAMSFRVIEAPILLRDESAGSPHHAVTRRAAYQAASRDLAHCFQGLANFDNGLLERLGRYETALWRQMVQILYALGPIRCR
jgi:hypothetical protein